MAIKYSQTVLGKAILIALTRQSFLYSDLRSKVQETLNLYYEESSNNALFLTTLKGLESENIIGEAEVSNIDWPNGYRFFINASLRPSWTSLLSFLRRHGEQSVDECASYLEDTASLTKAALDYMCALGLATYSDGKYYVI